MDPAELVGVVIHAFRTDAVLFPDSLARVTA